MKKVLAMFLGGLMAAGGAAQASAASLIDFTGYYRVNYMVDHNPSFVNKPASFTDQYFDDRLQLELTFRPTDELAVHWALRGPDRQRWGGEAATALNTLHIYGEAVQDWGVVSVGRLTDDYDMFGLASLGYQPSFGPDYVNIGPFDGADFLDGLRYAKRWDNGLGVTAQYNKMKTDWDGASEEPWDDSDNDVDRLRLEATYQWDGGGLGLGLIYDRDAGNHLYGFDPQTGAIIYAYGSHKNTEAFFVNPSFVQAWGNFSLHFEGMAGWGNSKWGTRPGNSEDFDRDGYGGYLDIDYNYGPGNLNLAGWWVSGSNLGDEKSHSLVDIVGGNFYPLMVAYGGVGNGGSRNNASYGLTAIGKANDGYSNYVAHTEFQTGGSFLNGASSNASTAYSRINTFLGVTAATRSTRAIWDWDNGEANHWGVAFTGNHAFTDDIAMHYGIGYLALNHPNYAVVNRISTADFNAMNAGNTTVSYKEQDKDLGFELDLGFRFQLLDNLSFHTGFGYMFTGDAYRELLGYNITFNNPTGGGSLDDGGTAQAQWRNDDDAYVWYNTLQFNF